MKDECQVLSEQDVRTNYITPAIVETNEKGKSTWESLAVHV